MNYMDLESRLNKAFQKAFRLENKQNKISKKAKILIDTVRHCKPCNTYYHNNHICSHTQNKKVLDSFFSKF